MDRGQLGDLGARRLGLCLGGADLLLAEAVADAAAVRVSDLERAGRGALRRRGRRARRRGDHDRGQQRERAQESGSFLHETSTPPLDGRRFQTPLSARA